MPRTEEQKVLFFSGGTPEQEDTKESQFPYPGLIGHKGPWNAEPYYDADAETALGAKPGFLEIQLVRVDSTSPTIPTAYDLAWWSDETNVKVTTESDEASRVAGVFMADLTDVTSERVTYIAKTGLYPTRFIGSPTVAPDALGKQAIPSSTDAEADCVNGSASVLYVFGRVAGAQVNDPGEPLDDVALVSLKIVD